MKLSTSALVRFPLVDTIICSKIVSASLRLPSQDWAMTSKDEFSATIPSDSIIDCNLWTTIGCVIFLKSYLWHLDRMVGSIFWGSVVHKMKVTWLGGSSKVFRNALDA